MTSAELLPLILTAVGLGFMGSGHCVGMCGGIAASLGSPAMSRLPKTLGGVAASQLLFNLGRITSYVVIGALIAAVIASVTSPLDGLHFLRWLAALMTIAIGLSITGWLQLLKPLETAGAWFWSKIQPLTKPLIPAKSPVQLLGLGMLWGWLPCGLVYSAASYALVAGSAYGGAVVMLAFGLGTLPAMLITGFSAQWLVKRLRSTQAKTVFGVIVILMGSYMLYLQFTGHEGHDHSGHHDHSEHHNHDVQQELPSTPEHGADEHHHHHLH